MYSTHIHNTMAKLKDWCKDEEDPDRRRDLRKWHARFAAPLLPGSAVSALRPLQPITAPLLQLLGAPWEHAAIRVRSLLMLRFSVS
jgi:hypothetical protein